MTVPAVPRHLLDDVDLTVDHGTCCAVMGPSGAGKSTLLLAIAGLVAHRGTIALDGDDLGRRPPHRRHVGLLFQQARLFPTLSALDNVAYPLRIRRVGRSARRAVALERLEEVGLAHRAGARAHELSGGERQRVALARALCAQPRLLLLDEPLTGLDLPQRRSLVELLAALQRERQHTWLVVTHDPVDARALADTVAVLDAGRLVQHDRADTVWTRPATPLVSALIDQPSPVDQPSLVDQAPAIGQPAGMERR